MMTLPIEPLTQQSFAPFGEVLETNGAESFLINNGTTTRFHALSKVQTDPQGHAIVSIFRGVRKTDPMTISMLERHPLGSQAFMPLSNHSWLVIVAQTPAISSLRCFLAAGNQGVQYSLGVWHHPVIVLAPEQDFLVVDRAGEGLNVEEHQLSSVVQISAS